NLVAKSSARNGSLDAKKSRRGRARRPRLEQVTAGAPRVDRRLANTLRPVPPDSRLRRASAHLVPIGGRLPAVELALRGDDPRGGRELDAARTLMARERRADGV